MNFLLVICAIVIICVLVLIYAAAHKMIQENKTLHSTDEDADDNLDLPKTL
jgi:uncharacterized membrane protein